MNISTKSYVPSLAVAAAGLLALAAGRESTEAAMAVTGIAGVGYLAKLALSAFQGYREKLAMIHADTDPHGFREFFGDTPQMIEAQCELLRIEIEHLDRMADMASIQGDENREAVLEAQADFAEEKLIFGEALLASFQF